MKITTFRFLLSLVVTGLFTSLRLSAEDRAPVTDPREAINEAIKNVLQTVEGNEALKGKIQFVKVGSHVSGKNYRSPITVLQDASDHDFRLVLADPDGTLNPEETYKKIHGMLKEALEGKVKGLNLDGDATKRVVNSINLYPPSLVTENVISEEQARELFKNLGINPSMGEKEVEGLWGKGAFKYTTDYEELAGRLIYVNEKGNIMEVGTDFLHLAEDTGKYTTEGCANLAEQFAAKGLEAAADGDAKTLLKDLKRMKSMLTKGKSLSRLPTDSGRLPDLIARLEALARQGPEAIGAGMQELMGEVNVCLRQSKADARILKALGETSDLAERAFLRSLIEPPQGRWAKINQAFWDRIIDPNTPITDVAEYVANWGLVVIQISAIATSETDADKAFAIAKATLDAMGGWAASLPAEITQAILQAAYEGGIQAGARAQDCLNLLTGIYHPWGVTHVSNDTSLNLQVGDVAGYLATHFNDTSDSLETIKNLTHKHAVRAAELHQNPDSGFRQKLAKAIEDQCYPQIIAFWRKARNERIVQINQHLAAINRALATSGGTIWLPDYSGGEIKLPPANDQAGSKKAEICVGLSNGLTSINRHLEEVQKLVTALEAGAKGCISCDWRFQLTLRGPNAGGIQNFRDLINLGLPNPADKLSFSARIPGPGSYTAKQVGSLSIVTAVQSADLWDPKTSDLPQPNRDYDFQAKFDFSATESKEKIVTDTSHPKSCTCEKCRIMTADRVPQETTRIRPMAAKGIVGRIEGFDVFVGGAQVRPIVCWDFGDGQKGENPSLNTVEHTYHQPGTYTISVRALDGTFHGGDRDLTANWTWAKVGEDSISFEVTGQEPEKKNTGLVSDKKDGSNLPKIPDAKTAADIDRINAWRKQCLDLLNPDTDPERLANKAAALARADAIHANGEKFVCKNCKIEIAHWWTNPNQWQCPRCELCTFITDQLRADGKTFGEFAQERVRAVQAERKKIDDEADALIAKLRNQR
jgi:hypothetical protein